MQPARYDFTIRRGDTETLGLVLKTRDLATGQVRPLLGPGDVVTWTIARADGDLVKTTAPGGGLIVDPETGAIHWPLAPADTRAFPPAPSPFTIRVSNTDGVVKTHLVGTIIANG